jgi:hypothetical protein
MGLYDGTYIGSPTLGVSGAVTGGNTAVGFNGASQYVTGTTLGNIGSSLGSGMTVEAWVKKTNAASRNCIAGTINAGISTFFEFVHNSASDGTFLADSLRLAIRGSDGLTRSGATSSVGLNDGNWHHVVAILNPSSLALYIDGAAKTVSSGVSSTPATFTNFDFPVGIGARNVRGTFDSLFLGTLDEVAIYNYALSSARILKHYQAATQ